MTKTTRFHSGSEKCRVTYILGNGFDLNLGMKTSYADIYASYTATPSKTPVIAAFKKSLANRTPFDKWADFEMGMAEYAQTLPNEDAFVECVRDFKKHMVHHLVHENERIASLLFLKENEEKLAFAFDKALNCFHLGLTPNDVRRIDTLMQNRITDHSFITFNYTSTLSFLFSALEEYFSLYCKLDVKYEPDILHIHGALSNEVILGVDNEEQLKRLPYTLSIRGKRTFIKPVFNEQFDSQRIIDAKKMIAESSIICIFGFSMGESDQMWVDCIADWLRSSIDHHIIYFAYDPHEYYRCNFDEMMDVEESRKVQFLERLGICPVTEIIGQVHVPIGDSFFDIKLEEKCRVNENKLPTESHN